MGKVEVMLMAAMACAASNPLSPVFSGEFDTIVLDDILPQPSRSRKAKGLRKHIRRVKARRRKEAANA